MDFQDWLWLGVFSFAAGFVLLYVMGRNSRTRDEESHWLAHLFVLLAAFTSYLVMATGDGRYVLDDGRDVFYAR